MGVWLTGARLIGGDGAAVDVRIAAGTVERVVPAGQRGAAGDDEIVRLDGRYLGPALRDAHVHFAQWAMHRRRLDVAAADSAEAAAELVRAALAVGTPAAGAPADGRLVGRGLRHVQWSSPPHRDLLDRACRAAGVPDTEVVLVSPDLHSVWLGTTALARYGLAGHPTGLLREAEAMRVLADLADVAPELLDSWVLQAARAAAARGVVEITDFEWAPNPAVWRRRVRAGNDLLRVRCGMHVDRLDEAIAEGLRTGDRVPDTGDLVTVGPLKVIADGSLNTRTAYCDDPYPGSADHGTLNVEPAELTALLRRAVANGITPAVHAIGDAANRVVLDALAEVGGAGRIEHAQLIDLADLPRLARPGLVVSVQPEHAMDDRAVLDRLWPGRGHRAYAFNDMVAAGATLIFGSDAPVAPLDPWAALSAAVFRHRDGHEPWYPEQCLSPETAYRASAVGGRLRTAVGDPADLVVVEVDPLTADAEQLRRAQVHATVLCGRFTHRSW